MWSTKSFEFVHLLIRTFSFLSTSLWYFRWLRYFLIEVFANHTIEECAKIMNYYHVRFITLSLSMSGFFTGRLFNVFISINFLSSVRKSCTIWHPGLVISICGIRGFEIAWLVYLTKQNLLMLLAWTSKTNKRVRNTHPSSNKHKILLARTIQFFFK